MNKYGNRPETNSGIAPQAAADELQAILESAQGASRRRLTYHDQCELLISWAKASGRMLDAKHWIKPATIGGKEHHVWLHESSQHVIKVTHSESFGRYPCPEGNLFALHPGKIFSYLRRLAFSNHLFGDAVFVVGIALDEWNHPRIVTAQPLINGRRPASLEMAHYFLALGFQQTEASTIYFRPSDRMAVFDAHEGNALLGADRQLFIIDVVVDTMDKTMADLLETILI